MGARAGAQDRRVCPAAFLFFQLPQRLFSGNRQVPGGPQSLHTNSLDETYALPSEDAVTIALRTQQILAHESGVANTIDPLGGAYFIEALTSEMEAEENS